jgi:GNAT superfamily N-acetyltransferase
MQTEDVSVVRTELDGHESVLRELLLDYFEVADELAVEHFESLSGIDVEEAAQSDLDRLADADVVEPLFLAREDDRIVGTAQLKRLDQTTAEIKRLYVVPSHRGESFGRRLMDRILDEAAEDGFETLRLGVGPYLEPARALYEDLGFEYTPPYDRSQVPPEIRDEWKFMRFSLADSSE